MTESRKTSEMLDEQQLEKILKQAGARPVPPADVALEIRQAVHGVWKEETELTKSRIRRRWYGVAASVFVLISVMLFQMQATAPAPLALIDSSLNQIEFFESGHWVPLEDQVLTQSSRVRTGAGAHISLTLSSGMNLRLDENTEVTLLHVSEIALEQGGIYVDSYGQRPEKGFTVRTRFGTASDIGTQFIIRSRPAGWEVQVREGAIELADRDNQFFTRVEVGNKLSLSASNETESTPISSTDPSWAWVEKTTPVFIIEGHSLTEYLDWMARETGNEVQFSTGLDRENAENTILHGSIEGLAPGDSLATVLDSAEFEVISNQSGVILIGKQKPIR